MNCQSISDILDERRMDRLTAAERCDLDRHLAECADCASACRAEAALAFEQVAPTPLDLADRMLASLPHASTAAVRRRPLGRLALGAAVLALGGAFAAVALMGQRPDVAEPSTAPTPAEEHGTGSALGDTPRRSPELDAPLVEVDASRRPVPRVDAVRFPDGDYFALFRVPPEYPGVALRERREGFVRVTFTITKHGTVSDVAVVESSDPVFDGAAALSIERWKYMPRVVNGEPVAVPGLQTVIRFALEHPTEAGRIAAAREPVEQPPADRPPLRDLIVEAWDCAAVRNLLCAQQVLDRVSAAYALTQRERQEVDGFYGYLYTQYGDFERAIGAFRAAAGDDPASTFRVTLMHLYFTRDQYQLALDTGVRYLAGLRAQHDRSDPGVEQFVAKLEALGMRPSAAPAL